MDRLNLQRVVPVAEFRRMALLKVLDLLRALRRRWESRSARFQSRQAVRLIQYQTLEDLVGALDAEVALLGRDDIRHENVFVDRRSSAGDELSFDEIDKLLEGPRRVIADLRDRNRGGLLLLHAYNELMAVEARFSDAVDLGHSDSCRLTADDRLVYFFVDEESVGAVGTGREPSAVDAAFSRREGAAWRDRVDATRFVAAIGKLLHDLRRRGRRPNAAEWAAVHAAYGVLAEGTAVSSPYRSLGVPGFKPVQTILFLTDPGDGHLHVTCHLSDLFEGSGAAVHVEHIDRDETKDKDTQVIEAYRLPAPINAAKVRLHMGADAVCTAFIGRPVFENRKPDGDAAALHAQYLIDRLKAAHMTASCCTAMFLNGIAECKIAIERMTAGDAVDFMRAVAGNVFRDRHRQYLSAAFNMFTPIYDDRSKPDAPRIVTDPKEICALGIELAEAGGFQKVTWDGAKPNQFPSLPVLARGDGSEIGHAFWVDLVHRAHCKGLTTYVSAGLEPQHVPRAVYAALDGVGIGVKLHFYDAASGRTGDFDPRVMSEVLAVARRAQVTTIGRAAKVLARLGRLKYEGLLRTKDDERRKQLLACLTGLELPSGLPQDAPDEKKSALTSELLRLGDNSDAARTAASLLAELRHISNEMLADDAPLDSPLDGEIRRLEEQLSRPDGLESTRESLQFRLSQLRGERGRREQAVAFRETPDRQVSF